MFESEMKGVTNATECKREQWSSNGYRPATDCYELSLSNIVTLPMLYRNAGFRSLMHIRIALASIKFG